MQDGPKKEQGLSIVSANKAQTSEQWTRPYQVSSIIPSRSLWFIRRSNTQTKSFIAIIKTGMILTQKCLNSINKCSCCRNYNCWFP